MTSRKTTPKEGHRLSLKEVAEAAGVSRMTVSLALRNHPKLPEETRRRIRSIAAEMGYRPDPDVEKLMEKIRERKQNRLPNVIAYLLAHERRNALDSQPTQRLYYEGALERAERCGYRLEIFWLGEPGMSELRMSEILRHRRVEGVLVAPLPTAQDFLKDFHWEYLSAVLLGYSLIGPAMHRSCNHQFQSMMLLMKHLQKSGYRKIGLAMDRDQDRRVNHNWRAAFLASQHLLSPAEPASVFVERNWNRTLFSKWLKRAKPEAIVTVGTEVETWLKELGLRMPDDIGLANVDLRDPKAGITGIDQNSRQVGAAAIDLLISLMRNNERGLPETPVISMVEGKFVQGNTTLRA